MVVLIFFSVFLVNLADDLPGPLPIGEVSFLPSGKSTCPGEPDGTCFSIVEIGAGDTNPHFFTLRKEYK